MKEYDENECSICFEKINYDKNDSIPLECNHEFHDTCILSWLNEKKECPICRSQVITDIENAKDDIESIENQSPISTLPTQIEIGKKNVVLLIGKIFACLYLILYIFINSRFIEEFIWSLLFLITIYSNTTKFYAWLMIIFGTVIVFEAWYELYEMYFYTNYNILHYINIIQIILLSINTLILFIF